MRKLLSVGCFLVFSHAANAAVLDGTQYTLGISNLGYNTTGTANFAAIDGSGIYYGLGTASADFLSATLVDVGFSGDLPFGIFQISNLSLAPNTILNGITVISDPQSVVESAFIVSDTAFSVDFDRTVYPNNPVKFELEFTAVPLPATGALMIAGLGALITRKRKA